MKLEISIGVNLILFLIILSVIALIITPLLALSIFIVILIPGLFLVDLLAKNINSVTIKLILSCGLGLSFISFLTFLFKYLKIPLNLFTIILTIFSLISLYYYIKLRNNKITIKFSRKIDLLNICLIIILFLGLFTRLYPIRNMLAPLFADPAVEGTIARLIIDNQGIPKTWEPFLPISLHHQPGFSSIVAWINITSSIPIEKIILYITNIFHGIFPLSIFLLCYKITKNCFQSLVTSLITLLAAFPTFTFIAGMNSTAMIYFITPIIFFLSIEYLEKPDYRKLFLILISSIGAFLIHPTFVFFFLILFLPYSLFFFYRNANQKNIKKFLFLVLVVVFIPLFVTFSYFSNIFIGKNNQAMIEQWSIQSNYINPKNRIDFSILIEPIFFLFNNPKGFWFIYLNEIPLTNLILSYPFALTFTFILIYSFYVIFKKKYKLGYLFIFWYFLFLFFGPVQSYYKFGFPFWFSIYTTRIKFLIVMPIALIISYGIAKCKDFDFSKIRKNYSLLSYSFFILLLLVPIELYFITNYLSFLATTAPVTNVEINAISWIKDNVEKNSTILNFITDTEPGAFVGDAGQWIPVISGRRVVFPATSLTDYTNRQDIQNRIKIMNYTQNKSIDKEFLSYIKGYNVGYVFVSQKYMSSRNLFAKVDSNMFFDNPFYKLVYKGDDNVFIFKVIYPEDLN